MLIKVAGSIKVALAGAAVEMLPVTKGVHVLVTPLNGSEAFLACVTVVRKTTVTQGVHVLSAARPQGEGPIARVAFEIIIVVI